MVEANPGDEASDESLFSRIAAGDAEAFAAFYDRHESLFYGLALKILWDETEAEDVLQEAGVLIWERVPRYNAELGRPLSWAIAVVRNKALDRLRANRRRAESMERAGSEFRVMERDSVPDSPGTVDGESLELARRCLERLPLEQREALELAYFGGLTQTEIAERLDQPLGTIKARIRRGLLAMRDALDGTL
jgi:RNA polymerase sigma-70 factor (ECF subfamily)